MRPRVTPPRERRTEYATSLGISREAVDLFLESEVIDLHVDSFIWSRVFGYDLTKRHGRGLLRGLCYSQVDLPRLLEAGLGGVTWVITTNPARDARDREETFLSNLHQLVETLEGSGQVMMCRTTQDYFRARKLGKHAAFVGIQGGNALDRSLDSLAALPPGIVLRVTLVHLSSSRIGATSSPGRLKADFGLTAFGKQFVEQLDAHGIFVDLAHISKKGFWDAIDAHDRHKPLLVSHTGVSGIHEHWRNLDDAQIRAIADSGGVVGIMFHSEFLGDPLFNGRVETIVAHMEHVIRCAGPDHVALGSDWDGAICPPRDMRTCTELPVLVETMLRRGWPPDHIRKALGLNFLRLLRELRG